MRGTTVAAYLSIAALAFGTYACGDDSSETTNETTVSTSSPSTTGGEMMTTTTSTSSSTSSGGTTAGVTTEAMTSTAGETVGIETGSTGATPYCGDGVVDPDEECDEGDANDDNGACTSVCLSAACGDGYTQPGEECDDGDGNADDGTCKLDCTLPVCGDGIVQPGEACDDGNNIDDDACSNACDLTSCGDGMVQMGEECDDANLDNTDECNENCQFPSCEDGLLSGLETDIDCGGGNCQGCDLGLTCVEPGDCGSGNCQNAVCAIAMSCNQIKLGNPDAESGVFEIDVDGEGDLEPFNVYCDMETAGGGWTLTLNLDTSDGHVMWWANPKWTDTSIHGTVNKALTEDFKSDAFCYLTGATEILLTVHEEGGYLGWKQFQKVDGATMYEHLQGGDNTLIAPTVIDSFLDDNLWSGETLVRNSLELYANHCIQNGGNCTTGNAGSPDGDRISSHQATPANNTGGGLGNWHDMNYCCPNGYAGYGSGKICNNSAFRTTSEAQAGWTQGCGYNQGGHFGTDTKGPSSGICSNSGCSQANWSQNSGFDYDYAIFLR